MNGRADPMRHRLILLALSASLCVLPGGASAQVAGQGDDQPGPLLEGVIAVIPFFSRSAEPDHQWIGTGIAAEIELFPAGTVDFGFVVLGDSTMRTLVATNSGDTSLQVEANALNSIGQINDAMACMGDADVIRQIIDF